ncbi:hypothetical protein ACHAXS_004727 [Conticribra weissflogii]
MFSVATLGRRVIIPASRHLLTPIGAIINTVGVDRPGIVSDVTRIVTEKGGNVGESRAQLLGGHFSLMMLVEIAPSEMDDLHNKLQNDVKGMSTTCFDAIDPKAVEITPKIGFAGAFKLSGADNPGIVHKLTSILARHSLTIGNMKTSHEEAPFGGTELFTMEGRAVAHEPLASEFDWIKINAELQEMGESMNCDVEFKDVTGDAIRN